MFLRIFFLGWPFVDGTCWVSIGEKSRMMLKDLGNVAGLYDVTGQSGYPRSIINVEQIMDAPPSDDDIRTLVESARGEALIDRRRQNILCYLWFPFFWPGEPLDVPAHGLLSRVMGVASRSLRSRSQC